MFPSVDIRLTFKVLVLLFLCANLVPSIESKPSTEVGTNDEGSESPNGNTSNAVSSETPENNYSVESKSEQPITRKPIKSKPKRKSKKNKKSNKKKSSKKQTSLKPVMSSTENWSVSWSSEKSEEPSTENWSTSSQKSEGTGMGGNSEESSTEPSTENMTKSSGTSSSQSPPMEEKTDNSCMEEMTRDTECGKMIKGPIAPVFTPFGMDGEIDYSVIPQYMKHLHDTRVAAIVVGGTTGEALSMSPYERKQLLEHWLNEAKKYGIKVIAQVGGTDEPSVLDLASHAQEVGACGLLLLPQLFYKPKNTEDLVLYMETVSKYAPEMTLIYYDFPMMTGVTVNMTELFDMATKRIRNFVGVKSDLKTIFEAGGLLQEDQQIYLGNHHIASAVLMGHDSSIATVNNMFLDLVNEIIEAVHSGAVEKARRLQRKLNKIVSEISDIGDFQASMKAAFEIITGIKIGPVREPQRPLQTENRSRVRGVLMRNDIEIEGE